MIAKKCAPLVPCRGELFSAFLLAVTLAACCLAPARGQGPFRRSTPPAGHSQALAAPAGPVVSLGVPGPQRQPASGGHHGGWTGYGFGGVPTYQWGHFGARYRPYQVDHWGYYGHQLQWSFRRGL